MTHARIRVYLEQLAAATLETASDLRLLPLLFALLLRRSRDHRGVDGLEGAGWNSA
jgi:hypothetical protein